MATAVEQTPAWVKRLYLPSYPVSDAARYVGVHRSAVSAWMNSLGPSIPKRGKETSLSYLELVEMAFVATFIQLRIPMDVIRDAQWRLARNIGSEYPFATRSFKTGGFNILTNDLYFAHLDDSESDIDGTMVVSSPQAIIPSINPGTEWDDVIVEDDHGQSAWTELMEDRFAEFDYGHDFAIRWHLAGRGSQVAIDPRVAFGSPTVSGLPTRILAGRRNSGETVFEIAEDFGIDSTSVLDALTFENEQVALVETL